MTQQKTTTMKMAAIGAITVLAGAASASIPVFDEPLIIAPCDDAQVEVIWMGSDAGYTGELSWINTDLEQSSFMLMNNKSASVGDSYILPRTFAQGERIDFKYEVVIGGLDVFSTDNTSDWSQFQVDDSDPLNILVGVEDIRYPSGDMDHNDAMFRVVFSHANVPTPGAIALLGGGGLVLARRRRS